MRFWRLLFRALRRRCPMCGEGRLFRGWIIMHQNCPHCGIRFEREPGFFLGSIYFNYGLTALTVAVGYPILLFSGLIEEQRLLWSTAAFALLFPIWFFRYARSLWLGFDQFYDPRPETELK